MMDRQALLNRLRTQPESQIVCQLRRLLERDDVRLFTGRGYTVTVPDTFSLWSTRVKNLDLTGIHYDGAESLLATLKGLPPEEKLEQIAIIAPEIASNLFFEESQPHRFVGAVLFNTKPDEAIYADRETVESVAS